MIRSQNLDDQTFDGIVESAVNKIPYIYPEWTDYNPHDPGITLIELFAWYKEMQQYHMNVVTRDLKLKLLKLVGVRPKPAVSAGYLVEFPPGSGSFPVLSRMENSSEVAFELMEHAHVPMNAIDRVYLETENSIRDLSQIAATDHAALTVPFKSGMVIRIGMRMEELTDTFRLWFDIAQGDPPRNPFESPDQLPRRLAFCFSGVGRVQPVADETHGLTVSGFICFQTPKEWKESDMGSDLELLHYLSISVEDPGCEAAPVVERIAANVFRAKQRETLSKITWFTVEARDGVVAELRDALSLAGSVLAYVRTDSGLVLDKGTSCLRVDQVLQVRVDATRASQDGEPNLLIVSMDPVRYPLLLRDSNGLPGQQLEIETKEYYNIDGDTATLLCETLCEDGVLRPAIWQRTDDIRTAGPRDRVFQITVEDGTANIVFGDGAHGAVVPAGKAAILIADVAATLASEGNVPNGKDMPLLDAAARVSYRRESAGFEPQTVEDAVAELLQHLAEPAKGVTAQDYEAIAMETPGVKILAAKALTMFDPDAPVNGISTPVLTLVVIPAGDGRCPMPNEWFLSAVQKHVFKKRTICTRIKVCAPLYVGVHVSVRLFTQDEQIEDKVRRALNPFFDITQAQSLIGKPILRSEVLMAIGNLPETLKLANIRLMPDTAVCFTDRNGDLMMPRHAMPYMASLTVERM